MKTYGEAIEAVEIMRSRLLLITTCDHLAQIKSDAEIALDEVAPLQSFLVTRQAQDPQEAKSQNEEDGL